MSGDVDWVPAVGDGAEAAADGDGDEDDDDDDDDCEVCTILEMEFELDGRWFRSRACGHVVGGARATWGSVASEISRKRRTPRALSGDRSKPGAASGRTWRITRTAI